MSIVIGLTGGIASGKSSVARIFEEMIIVSMSKHDRIWPFRNDGFNDSSNTLRLVEKPHRAANDCEHEYHNSASFKE